MARYIPTDGVSTMSKSTPLVRTLQWGVLHHAGSNNLQNSIRSVPAHAFSIMFAEIIRYFWDRSETVDEFHKQLTSYGHGVGERYIEVILARERPGKRETNIETFLQFIVSTAWRHLFGKPADDLRKGDSKYMLYDHAPLTNRFTPPPTHSGNINCAAYIGGIVEGMLCGAQFPCTVTTHFDVDPSTSAVTRQVLFLITLDQEVLERTQVMGQPK